MYKCFYCGISTDTFRDIIYHLIDLHPNDEIKFRKYDSPDNVKVLNYRISPELCREQGRTLTVDDENKKLHVSKQNTVPKDSPFKKIVKLDAIQNDENNVGDGFIDEERAELNLSSENEVFKELVRMLPDVIKSLDQCGKLEDFVTFNKLVMEGKFPLNNIALLLFFDVVRWFALEKSTTFMRYSEECKLFWSTGLKLFKGRFLRFMGGSKNKGQLNDIPESPGNYSSEMSKVNFIVPDRRVLNNKNRMVPIENPGIIDKMIDKVADNDPDQTLTYKLCVDGKKINPSSKGEVNLWGYETEPTFEMKQQRLLQESETLKYSINTIERQLGYGHVTVKDANEERSGELVKCCRDTVTVLSNRINDLRVLKCGKEGALKKLQAKCESDWRTSNYAIVISSLRTNLYQIENCIEDLLNIIEGLCKTSTHIVNPSYKYTTSDEIDLQKQENYVCLGNSSDLSDTTLIKQRSEEWFKVRDSCLFTGSNINKAIGLDGLKSQKKYIDTKSGRKEADAISPELQSMFDYGATNELNAVATVLSNFIPAFYPNAQFYEEGCYVKEENGKPYLVVSPDGSLRNLKESNVISAIEIKCPMPGKLYSTPVQYTLPKYYVSQVLSEMDCLDVGQLLFISYSKESTAIHLVQFDELLWADICNEIKNLDSSQTPKRLSANVQSLKMKIDTFRKVNVSLIAEVKSKTAKSCEHADEHIGRIFHIQANKEDHPVMLKDAQKLFIRASEAVQVCHKLCCQKANEVLVFLLADLDRIYKSEVPHAFPVAYAFKGYSMTAEAMRKMIQDVLNTLFLKGLYTPVISYDGQWASLAFKAEDGQPLTLVELQKQVYNNVKSRRKCQLTDVMFKTAVVKANTCSELARQTDYAYNNVLKSASISTLPGTKLFRPSSHSCNLLKTYTYKPTRKQHDIDIDDTTVNDTDYVFSSVSEDVLRCLGEDEIQEISEINSVATVDRFCESNNSSNFRVL